MLGESVWFCLFLRYFSVTRSLKVGPKHSRTIIMPTTLFQGYKQVESFGPDDEYEEDEEVVYVTLDLGQIEPTLVPSSSTYRLIVRAFCSSLA